MATLETTEHTEHEPRQYSGDERWELARRVARSATFSKSEQMPKLLLYVCKVTIAGHSDEINEQRIGVDVFGRSPNYDPGVDGIVRSHATRLRQRLELYFNSEGSNEIMRIEIPRGGYVPRFYTFETPVRPVAEPDPLEFVPLVPTETVTSALNVLPETFSGRGWTKPFFCGLIVAVIAAAVFLHLRRDAVLQSDFSRAKQSEVERRFWSTLFPANGRTLIVPGDSGLVLYETVTGHEITLADYINGGYRDPNAQTTVPSSAPPDLTTDLASRRYTSFVDLGISSQLSHLPQWSREHVETIFARDLRPSDANTSNLILIGSRQANPWVSLVEPSMNFVLKTSGNAKFYFLNRNPLAGEQQHYLPSEGSGNLGASNVFGDVAYLPNPSGQGMVLALSGLWMSGTQSAANFIFKRREFADWLNSIANEDGSIPPFELLISTKNLQGNATYSSIIAKRVYKAEQAEK